jgi:hypothetical protein
MMTRKARGDTLLADDEREELMLTRRGSPSPSPEDRSELHASLAMDEKEVAATPAAPMSAKDTWNFALLVVLCKSILFLYTSRFAISQLRN